MEIQPPSIELKVPSGEIEIPEGAATGIDVKMKKPRMSFGWFSKPEVKAPEVDVSLTKVDISLTEGKVEVKEPDVEMKAPEVQVEMKHDIELEGQGSKLPTFGLSLPKVKGPEIGLSLSKTDVDVDLPEGRADLQLPDLEVGVSSVEVEIPEAGSKDIDVKMKKPRMSFPKFGFSKPEVKAREVDINLPEVDISLPEGKVEVKEPEVEMKTPEIKVDVKDTVGSPSRFKMPTLKIPKFGAASPNVTIEVPDLDKDIKVHGTEIPEPKLTISAINIEKPSVDPKGPSIDVDVNRNKRAIFTLPEVKMEVQPPSIELKLPSGEVEIPEGAATEIDGKMKKPRMSFGWFSKPEVKAPEVDVSLTKVDISLPEGKVEVKEPDVEMKSPEVQMGMKHDIEIQGQGSKFKLPKFGFSLPKVKGPEIGLSLSKTDVDVDLPEGRADLQLPDVEVGVPSVEVEIPESGSKGIDVKMKKPRMSFPKFGFSKPEVKAREVDINIPEVDVSLPEGKVEVKEPEVEMKTPHIQVDVKDTIGSPSRFIMPTFKFPKFGASSPNVKIQVSDLEKDIKVHGTEIPKVTISAINIEKPSVDLKGTSIDADVNRKKLEIFTLPEIKTKVQPPSIELKVPSGEVEIPEGAATEIDVKMKKPRMSFGWFSKPEVKAPEVDISLPEVDISLPEGKVEVKEPEVEMKTPESQVEMKNEASSVDGKLETPDMEAKTNEIGVKKPLISFPKIVFSRSEMTAPEIGVIPPNADISLPEGKVVKVPEVKIKAPEIEVDIKDVVGSPSRFKMSTFKFPKFGATSKVVVDVSDKEKDIDVPGVEILDQVLGASFPVDLTEPGDTVDLKGCSEVQLHVAGSERPSVEEGMAIADVDVHDVDISKLTIDDKGHGSPRKGQGSPSKGQGSPSKFKLPTFKMPRLSSSKSNLRMNMNMMIYVQMLFWIIMKFKWNHKVLRSIDVEFDVPTLEDVEEKLTGSREEITASRKTELNAQPSAETQSVHEEEEAKEKSKFVWFKFPTFGLSSPSESAKILEKETSEKDASEKSPAGDSVEQDASLTFSVQSSDAFADISSTVTSEQVGPSLAFPTKVTVKYSDPIATEIQGNIITSTARTKMISFEPYLAEKVTIPMSSGASSSSVDTLKLESGTHIITSNIQAIPDTQKATLLTDFGLQTGTAGASYASWSVDDTNKIKSDGQTVIKRHVVRKMSGTDRETVVITRRAEPISDETASSIKQMKETMHSEKMKFFDGAELE
ncbi:unnamed protein product [Coregonus sp. 'balchen']|nr:unnamed protein product [Coregonus sp. 'balchen']